ncbi:unnamed protein product [Closterium sp. Naga37s-1]|nr:unnamed protein product [Closterium sp. Naga37s-1]
MSKSCKGLAYELVKCVAESPCVKEQGRPVQECAGKQPPEIPSKCVGLRETYAKCKRGQVDMRTRIRGNKGETENGLPIPIRVPADTNVLLLTVYLCLVI